MLQGRNIRTLLRPYGGGSLLCVLLDMETQFPRLGQENSWHPFVLYSESLSLLFRQESLGRDLLLKFSSNRDKNT